VRGTNPQPGALAAFGGEPVRIFDATRRLEVSGQPGEVLAVDATGVTVALQKGGLLIKRLQPAGGGKVAAAAFAADRGIQPGQRFEDGPAPVL
jgi:methionyl-tRNA formyltransferase